MVKALHRAGIEVILDVVYNHTAEGNHLGPMLVLPRHRQRRLLPARCPTTRATTSTSPAPATPSTRSTRRVLRLIMDSLRYWVIECHVDGFRFDLAAALARELYDVDRLSAFFDIIHQDPVLSQVKLIAEPWDVGPGGYQVGNFPVLWSEWNGIYRDTMRDFWRGEAQRGRLRVALHRLERPLPVRRPAAVRLDQLRHRPRRLHAAPTSSPTTTSTTRPTARTTATAPTTTARGTAAPRARPTTRRSLALRARQQRNFLATLLLSQGVPMLLGGDEFGRTQERQQQRLVPGQRDLLVRLGARGRGSSGCSAFTRRLIALRREHPVFRRTELPRRATAGGLRAARTSGGSAPTAGAMTQRDWADAAAARSASSSTATRSPRRHREGEPIVDDSLPAAVQRPPRRRRDETAQPELRPASGRSSSRRSTRSLRPAPKRSSRATRSRSPRDRCSC